MREGAGVGGGRWRIGMRWWVRDGEANGRKGRRAVGEAADNGEQAGVAVETQGRGEKATGEKARRPLAKAIEKRRAKGGWGRRTWTAKAEGPG